MDSDSYRAILASYEESVEKKLIPASTVVLLRDSSGEPDSPKNLEVLMVRRNPELKFMGGAWAFPGGKVDEEDYGSDRDLLLAGLKAAVREMKEEVNLTIQEDTLIRFSHWVPPPMLPKLLATWFFIAPAPSDMSKIKVDGSEICDYEWITPQNAIKKRDQGKIEIAVPTFVTLSELAKYSSAAEALTNTAQKPELPFYATKIVSHEDSTFALWKGDAGYEDGDPKAEGSRHRLEISQGVWELEYRS